MRKKRVFMIVIIIIMFTSINSFATDNDDWEQLDSKEGVSINKSWTIEFNKKVNLSDIEAIVIEHDHEFIPVHIAIDDWDKIKVTPVDPYEYSSNYVLKIVLINGNKYLMDFKTRDEADNEIKINLIGSENDSFDKVETTVNNQLEISINQSISGNYFTYEIDKNAKTLEGEIYALASSEDISYYMEYQLFIYDENNNELYSSDKFRIGDWPQNYSVNVSGVREVKLAVKAESLTSGFYKDAKVILKDCQLILKEY